MALWSFKLQPSTTYSMPQVARDSNMDVGGSKYLLVRPIKDISYKFKFQIFLISKRLCSKNLTTTQEYMYIISVKRPDRKKEN